MRPLNFIQQKKIEEGVPYFIGQHGANYGTYKYSQKWTEITTCDTFISWGWDNVYKNSNSVPAFNFSANKMGNLKKKNGGLLLIKRGPGYQNGPYDRRYVHLEYQKDMLSFFDSFPKSVKKQFIVRLHHGSIDFQSDDLKLWERKSPKIKISKGANPLVNYAKQSRLIVITYDSTSC